MYTEKRQSQLAIPASLSRKSLPGPGLYVQYQALFLTSIGTLFFKLAEINNLR